MDFPELSLAPTRAHHVGGCLAAFDHAFPEATASRKRKLFPDHGLLFKQPPLQAASVDLHLKDPLPLDWEQCLDLESGKMYYLNRKTLRKSWNWPTNNATEQAAAVDLELNMSTSLSEDYSRSSDQMKRQNSSSSSSSAGNNNNNNMVALACLNCHLLVILSKSSPACPNCKYVHSLPSQTGSSAASPVKSSPSTLSLLN